MWLENVLLNHIVSLLVYQSLYFAGGSAALEEIDCIEMNFFASTDVLSGTEYSIT
jgi:hypothetical protein